MSELPEYKCIKYVKAVKIKRIYIHNHAVYIAPVEIGYQDIEISPDYYNKYNPEPGGYYIEHRDGYKSFSSLEAFEQCYLLVREPAKELPEDAQSLLLPETVVRGSGIVKRNKSKDFNWVIIESNGKNLINLPEDNKQIIFQSGTEQYLGYFVKGVGFFIKEYKEDTFVETDSILKWGYAV